MTNARWATTCPACDGPIHLGDPIKLDPLDGDRSTWIHEKCPAEPAPRPVCGACFMEVSLGGECGC